eukprot:1153641-Pelagomonas_calceolata.AAC.3
MTLEPNSNGQKEANNGLLAAKPGGGSLGATLYHAGGHGAHTFIVFKPLQLFGKKGEKQTQRETGTLQLVQRNWKYIKMERGNRNTI